MKFQVYADKEIFENILLDDNKYENWNNIMKFHSDIHLNISQEAYDLDIEDIENSIIFQYLQQTAGKEPIPNEHFFRDFEEDNSTVLNEPFSTYFLNKSDVQINHLTDEFGLVFQNQNIDDNILSDFFFRDLDQNEIYKENNTFYGWQFLMKDISKNFNAMVLTDPYLFELPETINGQKVKTGVINVVNFLDSVLPLNLQIDFHLLLVTGNNKNFMTNEKAKNIYSELQEQISHLRSYNIIFEFIECPDTIHRRRAYTNYVVYKCDQGFDIFSEKYFASPKSDNDLTAVDIFTLDKQHKNDPHFKEIYTKGLRIKKGVNDALKNINDNTVFKGQKCFGFDESFTIKNRLLNYLP